MHLVSSAWRIRGSCRRRIARIGGGGNGTILVSASTYGLYHTGGHVVDSYRLDVHFRRVKFTGKGSLIGRRDLMEETYK